MIARERRRHLDAPVRLDAIELRFVASPLAPERPMQPETGLYRAVPACEVVAMLLQEILKFRFHSNISKDSVIKSSAASIAGSSRTMISSIPRPAAMGSSSSKTSSLLTIISFGRDFIR